MKAKPQSAWTCDTETARHLRALRCASRTPRHATTAPFLGPRARAKPPSDWRVRCPRTPRRAR
ncbi:MAG: hypothetical protein K2X34_09285, partial [Hyphomonadaceae bacterium]|nr:hypothetical protein [Hyphomonadaceae bacterium]